MTKYESREEAINDEWCIEHDRDLNVCHEIGEKSCYQDQYRAYIADAELSEEIVHEVRKHFGKYN